MLNRGVIFIGFESNNIYSLAYFLVFFYVIYYFILGTVFILFLAHLFLNKETKNKEKNKQPPKVTVFERLPSHFTQPFLSVTVWLRQKFGFCRPPRGKLLLNCPSLSLLLYIRTVAELSLTERLV